MLAQGRVSTIFKTRKTNNPFNTNRYLSLMHWLPHCCQWNDSVVYQRYFDQVCVFSAFTWQWIERQLVFHVIWNTVMGRVTEVYFYKQLMVLQANKMLGMQKRNFSDSVKTLQRKISEYINVSILSSCRLPGTDCLCIDSCDTSLFQCPLKEVYNNR